MIEIEITQTEKSYFRFLLPVQGSIRTLEQTDKILNHIECENEEVVRFEDDEINFIRSSIKALDSQNLLHLEMLPLIKKLL